MTDLTPYYRDEYVALYHGDCLEVSDWVDDGDVLVTDPPYGIQYVSAKRRRHVLARNIPGDLNTYLRDEVIRQWFGGPALVFGTWKRPHPEQTRQVLIWDTKGALGMGDTTLPWKPSHQQIYVLGHGFTGHRGTDVLTVAPVQSLGRLHPHEKPVQLMGELIRKSPPGVIADPFAGIGSTLVAAKAEGRKAIGVEVEERYCEIAARRLAQEVFDFDEELVTS